jgi:hypothetical protein
MLKKEAARLKGMVGAGGQPAEEEFGTDEMT